ncbi:MAG: 4-hydroxythreonine-4-phosphate dehydrogenase PdxA [Nitriliruptoraceae bacterium]
MGSRPLLAVTMGDPVGIGPEIVVRTFATATGVAARGLIVGDPLVVRRAIEVCDLQLDVHPVGSVTAARFDPGTVDVLDTRALAEALPWGEIDARAGRAAVAAIERATAEALAGRVDAVVTGPINKEAIWAAGSKHLGHTEMLGALTGSPSPATMFVVRQLQIFFTTRHLALREAICQVTRERVLDAIQSAWSALEVFGYDQPRLAVAALNPHGGEGGNFGTEELEHIGPACDDARAAGLAVAGPIPADSVFHQGLEGRFDGVLSHFHDQGHIAAKTFDFADTVSVTVGIPIVRTSVDHGTAFDIAGTGRASADTMLAAYRAGARFAPFAARARRQWG